VFDLLQAGVRADRMCATVGVVDDSDRVRDVDAVEVASNNATGRGGD
jgi:hypothetical protein